VEAEVSPDTQTTSKEWRRKWEEARRKRMGRVAGEEINEEYKMGESCGVMMNR